jgi:glycosyltransferase involved in cell wall biosynthesis
MTTYTPEVNGPNRPLVSVIVPCFNQARFLADALSSVTHQGYSHREVVVVDDGSTDETSAVAARFAGVQCFRQENRGTASARNRGFRESRGTYVVFLDADDRLLPEALAAGVEALEAHPECGFVYGHVYLLSTEGDCRGCPSQTAVPGAHYRELLRGNYIWTPGAVMYRRAVIDAVAGFDPRAGGSADYDLNIRIARQWGIHCHGHLVLEYREHADSQSGDPAYMLRAAVSVLRRQRRYVRRSVDERIALKGGIRAAQADYGERLLDRLGRHARAGDWRLTLRCLPALLRYHPTGLARRIVRKLR